MNANSKAYPVPTLRRSYPVDIRYVGTGVYQPRSLQNMTSSQILNQDILRSSSLESFANPVIDLPKTRRIINPVLIEEYPKSDYIHGVIKLKKRIIPNSLLYSHQQESIFLQVDPRKQTRNWTGDILDSDVTSTIPAGYRYKEMRLNHYGFYDIEYEKFNTFASSLYLSFRTFFVGLENNIPNSFLNGMLFLLWSIQSLKALILSHSCSNPLCLACELKFLFRMFDQGLEAKQEVGLWVVDDV